MNLASERNVERGEKSFQVEKLNDEVHQLRLRLGVRQHLETDYEEDLKKLEQKILQNEKDQNKEIESFKNKLTEMKDKCNRLEANFLSSEEENARLKSELKEKCLKLAETGKNSKHSSASEIQLEKVQAKVYQLEFEINRLRDDLKLAQTQKIDQNEQFLLLENNFRYTNEKLRETELFLADLREIHHEIETELAETKLELESLKLQQAVVDNNHAGKGNSLFSEVNDHRVKVENYASNLKKRNEILNDEIQSLRKEKNSLKIQIAKIFRISADNEGVSGEIRLLEEALMSKNDELKFIQTKFEEIQQNFVTFSKKANDSGVSPLDELIRFYKSQNDHLKLENEKQRMLKMFAEEKSLETQRNLCKITAEADRLRSELIFVQTNCLSDDVCSRDESTIKSQSSSKVLQQKNVHKSFAKIDFRPSSTSNESFTTNVNDSKTIWHSASDESIKITSILQHLVKPNEKENLSNEPIVKPKGRRIISNVIKISDCENF